MQIIDLLEEHAREVAKQGPDWTVFIWKTGPANAAIPFYYELTGAVAPRLVKGKGSSWNKRDKTTEGTIHILMADHANWLTQWEIKSGRCANCVGTGQQVMGIRGSEVWFMPCRICTGTGLSLPVQHELPDKGSEQPAPLENVLSADNGLVLGIKDNV